MSMLKITSLALSIALASGIAIAPTYASSNSKTEASTYETAHLKRKKRSHRHCHTSFINQRLVVINTVIGFYTTHAKANLLAASNCKSLLHSERG